MPDLFIFLFIAAGSFFAGLVDSMVGGGGLIQLPVIFSALPNETPANLFGTNKLASVFGTGNAALRFAKRIKMPWRIILPATLFALMFSYLGAQLIAWLPTTWVRPIVLVLLVFSVVYTFSRKEFGIEHRPHLSGNKECIAAVLTGASIGFYDGFFGPGTGSFLIFIFIRVFGFDFLHASASAKVINVATNIAALIYFLPNGFFLPAIALFMAIANVSGSLVGSHLALRHGSAFVRKIFIGVVCLLIAKITWDTIKVWL